ncbi:MAG: hypothetical protein LC789_01630 [Actinobacteria bacterium]|nr:hypothetical protein [Actinomycetota bacterium]MCA1721706.1 hypothetical protein [Actinomycetota bacterium]
MAEVRCADGSVLTIRPVPVLDRDGVPYEQTLELLRDGELFGQVGERCGWFLAQAAERLRAGTTGVEVGVRAWARDQGVEEALARLARHLPRDRELLSLRSRDPDDLGTVGELRVVLDERRTWAGGQWTVQRCAVLQAWGSDGTGVRAELPAEQLLALLDELAAG